MRLRPAARTHRLAPHADAGSAMDLLAIFNHRKSVLIGAVLVLTAFSALIAFQVTPRYTANTRLMIAAFPSASEGGATALSQALGGNLRSHIYGEIEVMQSDRLIGATVDELGLMDQPEFNPNLRSGLLDRVTDREPVRTLLGYLPSIRKDKLTETERRNRERQEVADSFRKRLEVRPPGVSNVVVVNFESEDPKRAASIVNTFVEIYIADHLERQFHVQEMTRNWLDKRIVQLRQSVIDSERAVAEFLASRRLLETGRSAVLDRQFADVSQQLTEAKAAFAERQTRLEQVYRLRGSSQGLGAVKEIRESPLIQRLREQEVTLIRQAAELSTRFGERHPRMINLRAEVSDIRKRVRDEEVRVVQELENEVRVASARVSALNRELDKLDQKRVDSGRDKIQLRQLQREADANQRLYETYLARLKQSANDAMLLGRSNVEVISPAQMPLKASYPRKGLVVGFGFLISIGVGVFLVLLVERLDNGFRSAHQLEHLTSLPVLGVVPRLARAERDGRAAADVVVSDPSSTYTEAIRSLRTSLMVSNVDHRPKVVLIASALPGEGKSSLAVALARQSALAALNGKVMLIDCDLRRPTVSGLLGLRAEAGITELFSGEASFNEVIRTDPKTGLHVLPAVPGTPNPPELLNSQHMRSLLDKLSQSYDLIVLDSPALESVSDARVLAHLADATIFVVQAETTPRQKAIAALRQLAHAHAHMAGVVLSRVNLRRQQKYEHRDAGAA
jgi:capsular exopolysaccharide synthesis family protein